MPGPEPTKGRDHSMIDYHVHTSLCNHATGTMEQYVRSALSQGLATICFLDHLTLQEAGRTHSMHPREVPMYVEAARRLARQYQGRIDVRVGLEVDFYPDHIDRCRRIIDTFDLDMVGGSVHFVAGEDVVSRRSAWARGDACADTVYTNYLGLLESMLDYDCFDVVCHLDLPKKYARRPSSAMTRGFMNLLEKVRAKKRTIELNTSGLHYPVKEVFPAPELLGQCARLKIPVVVGSDAHAPESVGGGWDHARELLTAAGYRHLTGFSHRQRERVLF